MPKQYTHEHDVYKRIRKLHIKGKRRLGRSQRAVLKANILAQTSDKFKAIHNVG